MVLVLLPWLLRNLKRPEYALTQSEYGHNRVAVEAGATASILATIIIVRFAFNALVRGPANRLAQRRGTDAHLRDGSKLLEELWVTLGNSLMLAAALFVMMRRNGGCWFLDTSTCIAGWPNLPTDPAVKLYYNLELAWYLHLLLKPVLRYGLKDGRDMLIHHFVSLALIIVSYGTKFTRIGVLVLALFAVSNPLLHLAKICNQLSLGPLKIGGFVLFAAAFFATRVLLVPYSILRPTLLAVRRDLPFVIEDFNGIYLIINTLLGVLYLMQLMWMWGILRVLRSALHHGSDAASRMSAQIDPAKRYAVAAEPASATVNGSSSNGAAASPAAVALQQARLRSAVAGAAAEALPKTPSPADMPALAPAQQPPSATWLHEEGLPASKKAA